MLKKKRFSCLVYFIRVVMCLGQSTIISISSTFIEQLSILMLLFNPLSPSIKLQILLLCFHTS